MSVKALEEHYNQVVDQYMEMLNDLKDMEKELADGLIDPEFMNNLKANIAPIKQNYEWWSYVMYLLHEPQRIAKRNKYRRVMSKSIENLDPTESPEAILESNKAYLEPLKSVYNMVDTVEGEL